MPVNLREAKETGPVSATVPDNSSHRKSKPRCKNCRHVVTAKFCSHCGQRLVAPRLDFEWFSDSFIEALTHLEKSKILDTIFNVTFWPGRTISEYLAGRRIRCHPPLTFLLISVVAYNLFCQYIAIDNGWNPGKFYGFTNLNLVLSFGFISLAAYIFLLYPKYTIFESVVVTCYIYGTTFFWAPLMILVVQAPFRELISGIPLAYRSLLVDAPIALFSTYLAIRICVALGQSLLRLAVVIAITLSFYAEHVLHDEFIILLRQLFPFTF